MNGRLYRSRADRMIAGVAGGIAHSLRLDPSIVRIVWAILIPLTGGFMLLVYIIMAIVVPETPKGAAPGPPPPGADADVDAPEGVAPEATVGAEPAAAPTTRGNPGVILGILLIFIGVWFLIDQYLDFDWGRFWPLAVIGLGVVLLLMALRRE